MISRIAFRQNPRVAVALLLVAGLAGCAGVGDSFVSGAFVDPAKYDQYDCKQLETERASLAAQTKSQQALIDKAQTGTAGTVVGELAYRNDFIAVRASAKLAEDTWQRNKCVATPPPAPPVAPPAPAKGARRH